MAEAKKEKVETDSVLDDKVATELFQEVKQGFRDWELDEKKYRTRYPVAKEENDSNWEYSKAFNHALKDGLPTGTEMDATLRERKLWTEEDDESIETAREKMGQLEVILSKKEPKDTSKATYKIAMELATYRQLIIMRTAEYQRYMSQTVEAKADEAKTAYLVSKCTENEDGTPVWATVDDFLTDKRGALVNNATYQFVTFTSGLSQDYIEQMVETKYLRAGKDVDSE